MRIIKAIFQNWIGFYTGLGVTSLEIDLSAAKHRMCLILAPNRSGKTTLLEGLTPFSDIYSNVRNGSKFIIDGKDGYRELLITHRNNLWISKVYWLKDKTKCYLVKKCSDGKEEDLNPSGNVRSYEEQLYIQFGLIKDHNKLLFLGPGMKDIISMNPSDRKANISKFTPNIDMYLQLHKMTGKYYSILKNEVHVISSEITRLGGDRTGVLNTKEACEEKHTANTDQLQYLTGVYTKCADIVKMFNLNGSSISSNYENRIKVNNELVNTIRIHNTRYNQLCLQYNITNLEPEIYTEKAKYAYDEYKKLQYHKESFITQHNALISSVNNLDSMLKTKQSLYIQYKNENDPQKFIDEENALTKELELATNSLNDIYELFPELKVIQLFTKEDAEKLLVFIDMLLVQIEHFKSTYGHTAFIDNYMHDAIDVESDEAYLEENKVLEVTLTEKIAQKKALLDRHLDLNSLDGMLRNIPTSCSNTMCPFIRRAQALHVDQIDTGKLIKEIELLTIEQRTASIVVKNWSQGLAHLAEFLKDTRRISNFIESNSTLIAKFPNHATLADLRHVLFDSVMLLPHARKFSEFAYLIERKTAITTKLEEVKSITIKDSTVYYNALNNQEQELQVMQKELASLNASLQQSINENQSIIQDIESKKQIASDLQEICTLRAMLVAMLKSQHNLKYNIHMLKKHYIACSIYEAKLIRLKDKIDGVKVEVSQSNKELQEAAYNLKKYDEFYAKQQVLIRDYELLDVLRRCWSSTTGIPLIFIEGFMNTLLSDANKYLAQIWIDSDIHIDGFGIDERNFFINICQKGIATINDASICSGAERATLCTVLSLALLKQFPKVADSYTITKFDEIDASLDYNTKLVFMSIINDLLDNINCEQAFMTSHSEIFQSDADVILLKSSDEYESRVLNENYNIIYRNETDWN
jgi:hypothetical protein